MMFAPFSCQAYGNLEALLAHIREGIVNATELAEMLGVRCGTISKWARKLIIAGLVRKKGREYEAVEERGSRVESGSDGEVE